MNAKESRSTLAARIGDFERARAMRREAAWRLEMSERLARVHILCKQMSAVKGAAKTR